MSENQQNNKFECTYSAPTERERREIEAIRRSYAPQESESKIERLKRLDNKVKTPPFIWALSVGIVGTLIFGLGLTMILEWNLRVWGALVAIVGFFPIGIAYPLHNKLLKKQKGKYQAEILKLSEEILNGNI